MTDTHPRTDVVAPISPVNAPEQPVSRWAEILADLTPIAFAVPVLLGILVSIVRLLGVQHLDLGWATTVNSDAEALYVGEAIHRDPADGYTGQLYTPLFPFLVSLLYRVSFWTGWPLLIVELSGLGLVVLAAWLAYRPGRPWSTLGAVGVGAVCWWSVSGLDLSLLYEARSDQFAWLLTLCGLVAAAAAGLTARRRPLLLAVLLLTAGFWTKQNTLPADVAAVAWFGLLGGCRAVPWRRVATFCAALLVVNLIVLGGLNIISGGWEWRLNFAYPSHHAQSTLLMPWIREGLAGGALAFGFLGVMAVIALVRRPGTRPSVAGLHDGVRRWHAHATPAQAAGGILAVFLVVGFVAAVYFRRKQGGADNQFLGVVWAAGLLGAVLWGKAGATVRRGVFASAALVAALVLVWSGAMDARLADHGVNVRTLHPEVPAYPEVPAALRTLAEHGLVYHTLYSDLNVQKQRAIYPNYYNFVDLLAAGVQPKALVKAFADRGFTYVEPLPTDPGTAEYSSAYGKWEENWMWKVDQLIGERYEADPAVPGMLKRRPGGERAVWQRRCFGPFDLAGTEWSIGHGGGFWCVPASGLVTQRGTPAAGTELRTVTPVEGLQGVLRLRVLPGHGLVLRGAESGSRAEVRFDRRTTTTYRVAVVRGDDVLAETVSVGRDGRLMVVLRPGQRAVHVDRPGATTIGLTFGKSVLSLITDQGSQLHLDLRGVRTG
jgi:hypothetical protein